MAEIKRLINTFITHMKKIGWDVALNERQDNDIPKTLTDRYANIPQEWVEFVGSVKHMVSPDETTWVLGAEDFEVQGDKAFQWNEWELMSLESAGNDAEWKRSIGKFWNQHLPIVMSVKGGYSYYAICIEDGSVVRGAAPEFEECETVASSFLVFMENIIQFEITI